MVALLSIVTVAARELWDAEQHYAHLQTLKQVFKAKRKALSFTQAAVSPFAPKVFPVTPKEWIAMHPDKDSTWDYQPIDCPVSIGLIEQRRASTAARRTHTSIRLSPADKAIVKRELFPGNAGATAVLTSLGYALTQRKAEAATPTSSSHACSQSLLSGTACPPSTICDRSSVDFVKKDEEELVSESSIDVAPQIPQASSCKQEPSLSEPSLSAVLPPQSPQASPVAPSVTAKPGAPRNLDDLFGEFSALLVKRSEKRSLEKAAAEQANTEDSGKVPATRQRIRGKTGQTASVIGVPPSVVDDRVGAGAQSGSPTGAAAPVIGIPRSVVGDRMGAGSLGAGSSGWPPRPPLEKTAPVVYKGCKVYTTVKTRTWRVVPYPGRSVYDKAFSWGSNLDASWANVMRFCDSPVLPESRRTDIL